MIIEVTFGKFETNLSFIAKIEAGKNWLAFPRK